MKKRCKILLTKKALDHLARLNKSISKKIIDKLEYFEKSENPLFYAKKLTDHLHGQYRFRVGKYRILFDINSNGQIIILLVLAIKHRRESYF